jgi:NAD(P)-dependent dehydrogenase (short-subunit alcohol dehydrogenase family)
MARVLITGSADGLGQMAAQLLTSEGHQVTLHARNEQRAADALQATPQAEGVVIGDLSSIAEMRSVAEQANQLGTFDAVIHNAGVGDREPKRIETVDGLSQLFAVNVLAPYLLTALITAPKRLIYLSSGLHYGGNPDLADLQWASRRWNGFQAYSDTKLFDAVLSAGIARRWPQTLSNAVEPGWVATKMGGPNATDDLQLAHITQSWLAVSDEPGARVTGKYFRHQREMKVNPAVDSPEVQDGLFAACAELSGEVIA